MTTFKEFLILVGLAAVVEAPHIASTPGRSKAVSIFNNIRPNSFSGKQLDQELNADDFKKLSTYQPKRLPGDAMDISQFAETVRTQAKELMKKEAPPKPEPAADVDGANFDLTLPKNRQILQHVILKTSQKLEDAKALVHSLGLTLASYKEQELKFQQFDLQKVEFETKKAKAAAELAEAEAALQALAEGKPVVVVSAERPQAFTLPNSMDFAELSSIYVTNPPIGTALPEVIKAAILTLSFRVYNDSPASPKNGGDKKAFVLIQNHIMSAVLVSFLQYFDEGKDLAGVFGQTLLSHTYYKIAKEGKDFGSLLLEHYDTHYKGQIERFTTQLQEESPTHFVIWDFLLEYGMLRPQQDILVQLPIKTDAMDATQIAAEVNKFQSVPEMDKLMKPLPSTLVAIANSESPLKQVLLEKYAVSAFHKLILAK